MTGTQRRVVSREDWITARKALLAKEKAFTRERDALSAARRELPVVAVDKDYVFEEKSGKRTLAELFGGKRQLVTYHFMFDPSWKEGCRACSFVADHFDGMLPHLAACNTSLVVIARAEVAKIEAFKERMGWRFRWLSSFGNDFNYDYQVSFRPEDLAANELGYNYDANGNAMRLPEREGLSVFLREGDAVFHAYSTYARGLDLLIGTYNCLDLTPLGRQESSDHPMAWLRHHDRYERS